MNKFIGKYGPALFGLYMGSYVGYTNNEWYWVAYVCALVTFILGVIYIVDQKKTKL